LGELALNRERAEEDAEKAKRLQQQFSFYKKVQLLNEDIQTDWLASLGKVASAYLAQSNYVQALQFGQERLKISQSRKSLEQTNDVWRWQMLLALDQIGNVYEARGDPDAAIGAFRHDLTIAQELSAKYPTNSIYERSVGVAFYQLARTFQTRKDFAEAVNYFGDAVGVAQRIFERQPTASRAAEDLSSWLDVLAQALNKKGDTNAVVAHWEQAAKFYERVHQQLKKSGNEDAWSVSPANAYSKLSAWHLAHGNAQQAKAAIVKETEFTTEALKQMPSSGGYGGLAFEYCKVGNYAAAKQAAEKALALVKPNENAVWIYGNLAHAEMFLGNQTEAERIHRQYRDVPEIGNGSTGYSWKKATQDDFELFDKLEIRHPGMDAIRRLLGIN